MLAGTRIALPDATDLAFLAEALSEANAYRAKHYAPRLVMDPELVAYARLRAASWSEHQTPGPVRDGTGENVYWGASSGTPRTASEAVVAWYDQVVHYDWADPPGDPARTAHFSRLVWKESTRVGAGRVAGQGPLHYETYVVFVLQPPGNVPGRYAQNVLHT
ncbi:CAP domain-containing protein [Actinomadura sp. ATCC 31491]|uniref:CAP domain-containing protein n=1 Tax=Actinomadura luzonensis TaxID=2805427 RepID=A0ABT0G9Q7_9ACTN|nr:CAP domain-containing protein [Actinomadura luzonensis]MCK2221334.1 CAP domain-containing protein [Actinomadura luzonensis]